MSNGPNLQQRGVEVDNITFEGNDLSTLRYELKETKISRVDSFASAPAIAMGLAMLVQAKDDLSNVIDLLEERKNKPPKTPPKP